MLSFFSPTIPLGFPFWRQGLKALGQGLVRLKGAVGACANHPHPHLSGPSMADANTPPAWLRVTPVSVRESRVSGCVCQGVHKCTCRWEAQFWNSQGTLNYRPVRRCLDHWSECPCSHPASGGCGGEDRAPTFLILCSWPWRPPSGQQLGVVCVCWCWGKRTLHPNTLNLGLAGQTG